MVNLFFFFDFVFMQCVQRGGVAGNLGSGEDILYMVFYYYKRIFGIYDVIFFFYFKIYYKLVILWFIMVYVYMFIFIGLLVVDNRISLIILVVRDLLSILVFLQIYQERRELG